MQRKQITLVVDRRPGMISRPQPKRVNQKHERKVEKCGAVG